MNNNDTNNDDSDHTGPSASMELELSPEECATEDDYHNTTAALQIYQNNDTSLPRRVEHSNLPHRYQITVVAYIAVFIRPADRNQ